MDSKSRAKDQLLSLAIQSYKNDEYSSIRARAKSSGVNESSIRYRLQNGTNLSTGHIDHQLLTPAQEQVLTEWILTLEAQGFAPTHAQAKEMAQIIRRVSGAPEPLAPIGNHWLQRFKLRNPTIATIIGRTLDSARVNGTSPKALCEWFALFERTITKHHIQPENIYNMDETGLSLGSCSNSKVLGGSMKKHTYLKSPTNREWVSIVETIGSKGQLLTPLAIFKGNGLYTHWFPEKRVPSWKFQYSPNGWTSNENCYWLVEGNIHSGMQ